MKKIICALFFFISISCWGQIPSDRLVNWQAAGYFGSGDSAVAYTDVTTFGAVGDGLTDNYNAITAAINSLNGNRGVIFFPAGEYLISQTIQLTDSVILKGAGADSTYLKFDFNNTVGNCINISGGGFTAPVNVTGGYQRGNNFLIVADTSGLSVGDFLDFFQNNGSWDTNPVFWADNSVGQILHLTGISADTIFFDQPLRFNYDSLLNPRFRKFNPAKEIGIECLKIGRIDNAGGLSYNINFYGAANCWIKGIESDTSISSHVEIDLSTNIKISESYFHHSFEYDGASTHGYGITLFAHSGQCLIENNIMKNLRHSFSLQTGANGNVIAYNYSRDPNRSEAPANYGADISLHGHFPYANLFEGNVIQNIGIDQTWGPNGPLNTFLRNRVELYGIVMTSGTVNSDTLNFVGNEIPNTGFLLGNYLLVGGGHYQYGNSVRGVLTPSGTNALTDTSYYLNTLPAFWSSGTWPSIGNTANGSNPAKDRYTSGVNLSLCELPIIDLVNDMELTTVFVYPNPAHSTISFLSQHSIDQVILYDQLGKIVLQKNNLTDRSLDITGLHSGIYFIRLITDGNSVVKKIMIDR